MKIIDISNCSDEVLLYINEFQDKYAELEKINKKLREENTRLRNGRELEQNAIDTLREQLQQKENIMKEVREYIEDLYDVRFTDKDKRKILEILDKENKGE